MRLRDLPHNQPVPDSSEAQQAGSSQQSFLPSVSTVAAAAGGAAQSFPPSLIWTPIGRFGEAGNDNENSTWSCLAAASGTPGRFDASDGKLLSCDSLSLCEKLSSSSEGEADQQVSKVVVRLMAYMYEVSQLLLRIIIDCLCT